MAPRAGTEFAVIEAAERGVRGVVVRLPPPVHDVTRAGLLSRIGPMAREKGVSAYLGAGENVWPAVHHLDAAHLFCLAVEKAAPGARLHAVAEEGIPMRAIAEAMGEKLGVPARSVAPEEAGEFFGAFAGFVGLDNPTTSHVTRETMGWTPTGAGLLDDIRNAEFL
jgi:nucleoside-diphosphate-sugar epimerase